VNLSRRNALSLGLGGIAFAAMPGTSFAATVEELTAAFTGGAAPGTDGITLVTPEIAENGNTVPVSVERARCRCNHAAGLGQPRARGGHLHLRPRCGHGSSPPPASVWPRRRT
jgi:hypothetical protein